MSKDKQIKTLKIRLELAHKRERRLRKAIKFLFTIFMDWNVLYLGS